MTATQYLVIVQQLWMNESGHGVTYTAPFKPFDEREAAIGYALEEFGHDDFNIGTLEDGRLVAFGWGHDDFGPGDCDLPEIGRQLNLPLADEAAAR